MGGQLLAFPCQSAHSRTSVVIVLKSFLSPNDQSYILSVLRHPISLECCVYLFCIQESLLSLSFSLSPLPLSLSLSPPSLALPV